MCKLDGKRQKKVIIYILIILFWMGMVFMFSSQNVTKSDDLSTSIAKKAMNIVHKEDNLTAWQEKQLLDKYDHYIRKFAHFSIYLIGGFIIISFIKLFVKNNAISILSTVLIGLLYAGSDEFHQSFVDGRGAMFSDVLLDTAGVITGALLYCIILAIVNKIKKIKKLSDTTN